jgi:CO dehydrogenase maturation factor
MPKVLVCGRGGSGKSTIVTMLAQALGEEEKVLVVDADESNLGLGRMLGIQAPAKSLMEGLGGKKAVMEQIMASLKSDSTEKCNLLPGEMTLGELPAGSVSWKGAVGLAQVGKVEHANEGCACPMGALAREFLKKLAVDDQNWVVVDTEAGLEHFGRGVFEGVEAVLMIVDPSYEAVLLAEKAAKLAAEAGRTFLVLLNKVDEETSSRLKDMLEAKQIEVAAVLPYSAEISEANLVGKPLAAEPLKRKLRELLTKITSSS